MNISLSKFAIFAFIITLVCGGLIINDDDGPNICTKSTIFWDIFSRFISKIGKYDKSKLKDCTYIGQSLHFRYIQY